MIGNKYGADPISTPDGDFDSKHEYHRWCELVLMQKAKLISKLDRQVKFVLIPTQKENGKVLERECCYFADFTYYDMHGKYHVEDAKSKATKTKEYIIKRKLMLKVHGLRIEEV